MHGYASRGSPHAFYTNLGYLVVFLTFGSIIIDLYNIPFYRDLNQSYSWVSIFFFVVLMKFIQFHLYPHRIVTIGSPSSKPVRKLLNFGNQSDSSFPCVFKYNTLQTLTFHHLWCIFCGHQRW